MAPVIAVPHAEACAALAFMLGWSRTALPFYLDQREAGRVETSPGALLAARAEQYAGRREAAVGVEGNATLTELWAWVRGGEQEALAQRFRPRPSVVLRVGSTTERLLVWPLREATLMPTVEAANRKLSYALHAPYVRSRAEALRVPLPGTMLRVGRKRPVPITCTRLSETDFEVGEVVGRLKDPPPADAWKAKRRR